MNRHQYLSHVFAHTYVRVILSAVFCIIMLGIAESAEYVFFGSDELRRFFGSISFIVIFMTILAFPMSCALALLFLICLPFRKKFPRTMLVSSILVILHVSFFLQPDRYLFNHLLPYLDFAQFALDGGSEKCEAAAVTAGEGNRLAICAHYVVDDGIWAGDSPYEAAIIYDSGDKLSLPVNKRTLQWQNSLKSIYLSEEGLQEPLSCGPVKPMEIFSEIKPLGWHFYYVTF